MVKVKVLVICIVFCLSQIKAIVSTEMKNILTSFTAQHDYLLLMDDLRLLETDMREYNYNLNIREQEIFKLRFTILGIYN